MEVDVGEMVQKKKLQAAVQKQGKLEANKKEETAEAKKMA